MILVHSASRHLLLLRILGEFWSTIELWRDVSCVPKPFCQIHHAYISWLMIYNVGGYKHWLVWDETSLMFSIFYEGYLLQRNFKTSFCSVSKIMWHFKLIIMKFKKQRFFYMGFQSISSVHYRYKKITGFSSLLFF